MRRVADVEPIIKPAELAAMMLRPTLRIVDASWQLDARDGAIEFSATHIPGAVFFDIDAISDHTSQLPHMLPTAEQFAIQVGALGISAGDDVVVYDNSPTRSAARAWWSFRSMGLGRVRVLDGGLQKWIADGLPVENKTGKLPDATSFLPRWRPELVRSLDQVRLDVDGERQIVDARPAPRFRGEAPEPRPGLRSGCMPGALNLPLPALYNADGTLRPKADLICLFEHAGADLSRPITATCGSGVAACSIALALEVLEYGEAAVYDGSWAEWGARIDTAVITAPETPPVPSDHRWAGGQGRSIGDVLKSRHRSPSVTTKPDQARRPSLASEPTLLAEGISRRSNWRNKE